MQAVLGSCLVLLALSDCALGRAIQTERSVISSDEYQQECGVQKPFGPVRKDGFSRLDCLQDYTYYFGDKFGAKKKDNYRLGTQSGKSIVNYADHVPEDKREPMSEQVCFRFCRTVPDMGFFGLVNGRNCYCTPYFKAMPEDQAQDCDVTCPGDPTNICGGKIKSSMFEMHMCASTRDDLADAIEIAAKAKADLTSKIAKAAGLAGNLQRYGAELQVVFGKVGDSAATKLMQNAKEFSGKVLAATKKASKAKLQLKALLPGAVAQGKAEKLDISKAEDMEKALKEATAAAADEEKKLDKLIDLVAAPEATKGVMKQYVAAGAPKVPGTCGGKSLGAPIIVQAKGQCASACDDLVSSCLGFQYFESAKKAKLCFLFSKIDAVRSYTGCKKTGFMQVESKPAPFASSCYAKFADFNPKSLAVTKANRCYGAAKAAAAAAAAQAAAAFGEAAAAAKEAKVAYITAKKIAAEKAAAMKKAR